MILKVSQNIARAATSYQTMLEALSQTGGPAPTESVLLEVIGKVIYWSLDLRWFRIGGICRKISDFYLIL